MNSSELFLHFHRPNAHANKNLSPHSNYYNNTTPHHTTTNHNQQLDMSHLIIRAAAHPLAAATSHASASHANASQATAPSTQERTLCFCGPKAGTHTTPIPHHYHLVHEAERWAISTYNTVNTSTSLTVKDIIRTSCVPTSHTRASADSYTLFTSPNKTCTFALKRTNTTSTRGLQTMTEAASQRVRLHFPPPIPTRETPCEFSRVQHALREARWEQVWKERQRMKEDRAVREVMKEAERRNEGWGMFTSLW